MLCQLIATESAKNGIRGNNTFSRFLVDGLVHYCSLLSHSQPWR